MQQTKKENKQAQMQQRLKNQEEFNSITNSLKVENQNQNHNAKKESLGPNTKM